MSGLKVLALILAVLNGLFCGLNLAAFITTHHLFNGAVFVFNAVATVLMLNLFFKKE